MDTKWDKEDGMNWKIGINIYTLLCLNVDLHSCHLLLDHFQFALIHGTDIPGSYAILLFTASDLASITSHMHNWVLFLLWFHPFILSGVIYWAPTDLGSSSFSILSFCLFILFMGFSRQNTEVVCIPFSSGPHFLKTLHHDLSVLGGPTWHGS